MDYIKTLTNIYNSEYNSKYYMEPFIVKALIYELIINFLHILDL